MEKETRTRSPEFIKLQEYCVALETTRRDLMGINEDLREKILALERGQEDFQKENTSLKMIKDWYEEHWDNIMFGINSQIKCDSDVPR